MEGNLDSGCLARHGDRTSGLYLDAATGYLGRWSRYNEAPGDELDTLVSYLEKPADILEAPALVTRTSSAWSAGRWCGPGGSAPR